MPQNTLRVLTYNVHKGFNTGNRQFVLHQIREALISADADLLFLQEMQGEHKHKAKNVANWPNLPQFEFIAEGGWPYFAYGKNAVYESGHHGNAILSKYPFQSWENINVSPFKWASRSLLHAVINFSDNKELHIVCVHLGLFGLERRKQLNDLCDHIDQQVPPNSALIIAGDFNDWLERAEQHFLERLNLNEAYRMLHGKHARTFPSWMPILPMDRVYYRGLIPLSCERLTKTPWHLLSDHAPLAVSFSP